MRNRESENTRRMLPAAAAAASLLIGGALFAQQSDRSSDQPGQRQQQTSSAGGQGAQASAQQQQPADQQIDQLVQQIAQDPKTAADKMFILNTVLENRAEIDLARQVMQKTQNPRVKQLAQRLADDLSKENQEITKTAQAIGLNIPPGLHKAQIAEVQVVAALPDDQLDKAFTANVQADNAGDVSAYQSESQIAQDPHVKDLAQRQLPAQQQRQQDWNQSAQAMGMTSGNEAQPAGATIRGGDNAAGSGSNNSR